MSYSKYLEYQTFTLNHLQKRHLNKNTHSKFLLFIIGNKQKRILYKITHSKFFINKFFVDKKRYGFDSCHPCEVVWSGISCKMWFVFNGPFVYRLGHMTFAHGRRVRFHLGVQRYLKTKVPAALYGLRVYNKQTYSRDDSDVRENWYITTKWGNGLGEVRYWGSD